MQKGAFFSSMHFYCSILQMRIKALWSNLVASALSSLPDYWIAFMVVTHETDINRNSSRIATHECRSQQSKPGDARLSKFCVICFLSYQLQRRKKQFSAFFRAYHKERQLRRRQLRWGKCTHTHILVLASSLSQIMWNDRLLCSSWKEIRRKLFTEFLH